MVAFAPLSTTSRCEGTPHGPNHTRRQKTRKATRRRRLNAHGQRQRQRQRAQAHRDMTALPQALEGLGLPDTLVAEGAGRFRAQHTLLGKRFGLRFPTRCGCRHADERSRVRGWDTQRPARLLSALPTRSWRTRLRRLGIDRPRLERASHGPEA